MEKCYYLSEREHSLLVLYDLTRFVKWVPNDLTTLYETFVIPYDKIDELARIVFACKYKGPYYDELVSFAERLQEILEVNDHS